MAAGCRLISFLLGESRVEIFPGNKMALNTRTPSRRRTARRRRINRQTRSGTGANNGDPQCSQGGVGCKTPFGWPQPQGGNVASGPKHVGCSAPRRTPMVSRRPGLASRDGLRVAVACIGGGAGCSQAGKGREELVPLLERQSRLC